LAYRAVVIEFRDDFDHPGLDESVWFPYYLPAWSSRARTRASYRIAESQLTLFIPIDRGLWCPDEHPEPLRVSGIQSGSYSGPVGTTSGQQRFRDDLRVREQQPRFEGWLPSTGTAAIRCRMQLSPRSMAAMWLAGFEEQPDDSGEICVVEVFGRSVEDHSAEVGVGVKKLHDPRLVHNFVTPRIEVDVSELHTYAVEWNAHAADFYVDDMQVHSCAAPPTYPLQAMLAVFDFPGWSTGDDDDLEPSLDIDWIAGGPLPTTP
jgi:Glycosyl hydrolases family 16